MLVQGCGDIPGLGDGLFIPGDPTPMGDKTDENGLPTEPTGLAGKFKNQLCQSLET